MSEDSPLTGVGKFALALVAALLAVRFVSLGLELLWRPLFPFDATMHWATKARVWSEVSSLAPFVGSDEWLQSSDPAVFTDHHPGYPRTIPLLQTWVVSAIGYWDSSLMNLPWLLCYAALGLLFFAQLRSAGVQLVAAAVFTYLLLSMPLLNTHVALAGYADLYLGACYGAAVLAFCNWFVSREAWQGILAIGFALGCLLIKNEGLYWMLTLLPGLVVVFMPPGRAIALFSVGLVGLVGLLILLPPDFSVAGHSKEYLHLSWRSGALASIATSVYVQASWHLFGYLLGALLIASVLWRRSVLVQYLPFLVTLLSALVLFIILFTYTRYGMGAIKYTAVGRISLHFAPALMFLAALLWHALALGREGSAKA